jgi:hypothetical protein
MNAIISLAVDIYLSDVFSACLSDLTLKENSTISVYRQEFLYPVISLQLGIVQAHLVSSIRYHHNPTPSSATNFWESVGFNITIERPFTPHDMPDLLPSSNE